MTRPYEPHPELFWWNHLTHQQRSYLTSLSPPIPVNLIDSLENAKILAWYEYAQSSDLHKLPGWPETTEFDLQRL